jgi:hypothetical protein
MTVQGISTGIPTTGSQSASRLFLPGANEFADTLSIGQIIQGKVLRGYEGNRYLVAFDGGDRVVDSVTPLTTGEILYGRVVGLGDRVELQRVYAAPQEKSAPRTAVSVLPNDARPAASEAAVLDAVLQRYRVELTDSDRATLLRAARSADDPEAMSLAGAMLSKLGLPQAGVLLESLYRAQLERTDTGIRSGARLPEDSVAEVLTSWQQSTEMQASSLRELGTLLQQALDPKTDTHRPGADLSDQDDSRDSSQQALAARILNAQTGGVVTHRAGLLPLLVGGRLVEISVAMFEQRRPATATQGLQHRQVVFSLHTESMGRVDVLARVTGGHVRVEITTDSEDRTAHSAGYAGQLESALSEGGWNVDEVAYGTRTQSPHNPVVRSVIEHVVNMNSLDRLV